MTLNICGVTWTLNSRNTSQVLNAVIIYQVSLNSNEADSLLISLVVVNLLRLSRCQFNKNTSIIYQSSQNK